MKKNKLIIINGFLGAGKTTLLQYLVRYFHKNDKTVGLITNDQAEELVDTQLLLKETRIVREISGSCFCCNYNGFTGAIHDIISDNKNIDLIIAEPVGSCTDISATILQPLKEHLNTKIEMSPYSVLADPLRLERILDEVEGELHPAAAYIYRKQLEEADVIVISKIDTIDPSGINRLIEKLGILFPGRALFPISAETGHGIKEWLKYIMEHQSSGNRIVDIDYTIYAEGEAILGWMNASLSVYGENIDFDLFLKDYFHNLSDLIKKMYAPVAHIKIMLESRGNKFIIGNMTGDETTIKFMGSAGTGNVAQMIINARVELRPRLLNKMIFDALFLTVAEDVFYEIKQCKHLQPGFPKPIHRYATIV